MHSLFQAQGWLWMVLILLHSMISSNATIFSMEDLNHSGHLQLMMFFNI